LQASLAADDAALVAQAAGVAAAIGRDLATAGTIRTWFAGL
jgi:uncharacterized protein (DUF849 family)